MDVDVSRSNQQQQQQQHHHQEPQSAKGLPLIKNEKTLREHDKDVLVCEFSAVDPDCFATASADGTCRIWYSGDDDDHSKVTVLDHNSSKSGLSYEVSTLDWHPKHLLVATGSSVSADLNNPDKMDIENKPLGELKIWSRSGNILFSSPKHHVGPIFGIKWNPSGTKLISAGLDGRIILYDCKASNESSIQVEFVGKYSFHKEGKLQILYSLIV
jgi:WD40 repeat protein